MKITIEISDDQVIAVLQETIAQSWAGSLPKYIPPKPHEMKNLIDSASYCAAANRVIEHFGGRPIDVSALPGVATGAGEQ